MELKEMAAVPLLALPIEELRSQLRLGSGFASDGLQDGLLERCLRAAMAALERRTGRALLEREFTLETASWDRADRHELPLAPVREVSAVEIAGPGGVPDSVGGWRLEADDQAPLLVAEGMALPTIPTGGRAIVRFRAGLAGDWPALPSDLQEAGMMLAAHYYDNRAAAAAGAMIRTVPEGVAALVAPWRRVRLGGAR